MKTERGSPSSATASICIFSPMRLTANHRRVFEEKIWQCQNRSPHPGGAHCPEFLLRYRNSIFPGIPVVYCAEFANEHKRLAHQNDITGTAMHVDLSGTLELARKLHPDLKRIAVVAGTGLVDKYLLSLFRNVFKGYEGKLKLIDLAGLPLHEILKRASLLPDSTVILYLTLQRDGDGRYFQISLLSNWFRTRQCAALQLCRHGPGLRNCRWPNAPIRIRGDENRRDRPSGLSGRAPLN